MNLFVKRFLLVFLGLIALWDAFTTLWAMHTMIDGNAGYILGAIVALVTSIVMLKTSVIVFAGMEDVQGCMMLLVWAGAFLFDMYTAYVVNEIYLIQPHGEIHLIVALAALTIITTASPAVYSFIKNAI